MNKFKPLLAWRDEFQIFKALIFPNKQLGNHLRLRVSIDSCKAAPLKLEQGTVHLNLQRDSKSTDEKSTICLTHALRIPIHMGVN
jgi:hypothetical protein